MARIPADTGPNDASLEALPANALLAALPDGAIVLSADGCIRSVNQAACDLLGILPKDLEGSTLAEIHSLEQLDIPAHARLTLKTGKQQQWEAPWISASGETVPMRLRLSRTMHGSMPALLLVLADNSEHMREQEALRESEARFRALADTSPDLMFSFDNKLRLTAINSVAAQSIGAKAEDVLGRHIADLGIPKEYRLRWQRKCSGVLASGLPTGRILNEFTLADGRTHLNETSLWPILAADGEVVGVRGVTRDITQVKQAEELLEASEQRYRTLFESANDGIVVHDLEGRILDANQVMSERLGLSVDDLVNLNVADIRTPEAAALYPDYVDEIRERGRAVIETAHLCRDGSTVPVEVSGRLVQDEVRPFVLSISRDISERKRAERDRIKEIKLKNCLVALYERASTLADRKLYDFVVEQVIGLTDSAIGFLFVVPDGQSAPVLATWKETASESGAHSRAGDLAEYVRPESRVIWNDFPSSHQEELPEGCARIRRLMSVPASGEGESGIIVCAGNKTDAYDEGDVVQVQVVANALQRIIGQRRAEELLKQSQARYNRFFRTSRDCAFITTTDGRWIDLNDAAVELFGYPSREELMQTSIRDLYADPEDRTRHTAFIAERGQAFDYPVALRKRDGSKMHTLITSVALYDERDHVTGFQGTIRDVTERERMKESLQLTQFSIDEAADLVHWLDSTGRILFANQASCRRNGYSREEMQAMTIFDLNHTLTPEVWPRDWRDMKEAGFRTFEALYRTRSGELYPVEASANYVSQGGREYAFVFARDITDRKRAEEALRESEERYRMLVESTSDLIYSYDTRLNFTGINRAAAQALGMEPDEVLGKNLEELRFPEATKSLWRRMTQTVLDSRSPVRGEFEAVMPDGENHAFEMVLHPVFDETGEITGLRSGSRDVTESKRAEEALRASEAQLRQSQRMEAVGQLAGGIAHDFNNLLTSIIGGSSLVMAAMKPDDPNRDLVVDINDAGERAAALTQQILAFSRRQVLRPEIVLLNDIISTIGPLLRRTLGEDIDLHFSLAPDLRHAEVDSHQIEQVLMNLAVNSRDAMPSGGSLTVETSNVELDPAYCSEHAGSRPGQYVLLAVSDTGQGMDEDTKSHIFEPFFTTKEVGKGTGLGLSTVFGIVKQSNGYISVYSEPGEGTSFKVYLPVAAATDTPPKTSQPQGEKQGGSETILVVEDEDSVRQLISTVLSRAGYKVLQADSMRAVDVTLRDEEGTPALLLTDVILPGGASGREVAEMLLGRYENLRVVYMSGYARDFMVHNGRLEKGIEFLEKPFTPTTLLAKVREVLDAPAAHDPAR